MYTTKMQVISGIFHGIPRENVACVSILHHVIQYTEANTVNEIYARRMIGRLDVIPLKHNGFPVFRLAVFFMV